MVSFRDAKGEGFGDADTTPKRLEDAKPIDHNGRSIALAPASHPSTPVRFLVLFGALHGLGCISLLPHLPLHEFRSRSATF